MLFPVQTPRLSIRPLALEDLAAFVSYRQDPEIARFQSWEPTYSQEDATQLIGSQVGVLIPREGDWLQLGVHELASDELVGDLALHSVPESDRCFEIGFTIARSHQGQGYAKEAASILMRLMFSEQVAKRFTAISDRRNLSSIRVLLALGFNCDPSRSRSEWFKNEDVWLDYFEAHVQHPAPHVQHPASRHEVDSDACISLSFTNRLTGTPVTVSLALFSKGKLQTPAQLRAQIMRVLELIKAEALLFAQRPPRSQPLRQQALPPLASVFVEYAPCERVRLIFSCVATACHRLVTAPADMHMAHMSLSWAEMVMERVTRGRVKKV